MSEGSPTLPDMHIILIPGFWLDASSWDAVLAPLRRAGHEVHALTLPGLESSAADRSGITLRDHIDAVVAEIDRLLPAPVVLVGHSGGGAVAHGAVDARPDRVERVVYVDSGPLGEGDAINDQLPVVAGEIPLPDWSVFESEDLVDLTDELRARFRQRAIPIPEAVAYDRQHLSDERRYDVPVTIICCEFGSRQLQEWLDAGAPFCRELAKVRDKQLVDLPTGHWPQFTRPHDLAETIVAAVGER